MLTRAAIPVRAWLTAAIVPPLVAAVATAVLGVAAGPARSDSVRDAQLWVLDDMRAPQAWTVSQGGGVTVAVLDSGVNPAVSDLAGSVTTGADYTHTATAPSSPLWGQHGTWMASLIAGHGHDGGDSGILGLAPRSRILSIRVITDHNDPGYNRYQHEPAGEIQQSLARAIQYAAHHHVAVISMSIGYTAPSAAVRAALQYATDHGIVLVASSGNSGDTSFARQHRHAPYSFPADYPGVLAVGAAGRDGTPAGFSSDNLSVQVAAPGVNVPAQGRDDQYWEVSGTSPACALVAGVAALIKARYPSLAPALVGQAIVSTTRHRPARGYDEQVGFGMVDAAAALAEAKVLAREVRGGGLSASAFEGAQGVVPPAQRFGGGPSAVPPPPVRPRGMLPVAMFALIGLTSLVLMMASVTRIAVIRRARGSAPPPSASPPSPSQPSPSPSEPSAPLPPAPPVECPALPGPSPRCPEDPGTVPPSLRGFG